MRFSVAFRQINGVVDGRVDQRRDFRPANDNAGPRRKFAIEREFGGQRAVDGCSRDRVKASADRAFFRDDMPAYYRCLQVLRALDQQMVEGAR